MAGPVDSPTDARLTRQSPLPAAELTLPQTTIARADPPADQPADSPSTEDSASSSIDQAVQEQAELLAEFQKLTDDLNEVLANLEGSTLVKRLKAASREQMEIAGSVTRHLPDLFGAKNQANASMQGSLDECLHRIGRPSAGSRTSWMTCNPISTPPNESLSAGAG